jgi:hypothetical protein
MERNDRCDGNQAREVKDDTPLRFSLERDLQME